MKYETSMEIELEMPNDHKPLTVNICPPIFDVINYSAAIKNYNSSYDDWETFIKRYDYNLTANKIFRDAYSWDDIQVTYSNASVNRFFLDYIFCYQIHPNQYSSKLIFYAMLSPKIRSTHTFLSYENDLPWQEHEVAYDFIKYSNSSSLLLKGFRTQATFLSSPYSNCTNYNLLGLDNYRHCEYKCINDNVKDKFNVSTKWNIYLENDSNDNILGPYYVKGMSDFELAKYQSQLKDEICKKKCYVNQCVKKTTFTHYERKYDYETDYLRIDLEEDGIWIQVDKPDMVNHILLSSPNMNLIEVVCFVAGSLGLWFGFCFYAIKPIAVYQSAIDILSKPSSRVDIDKLAVKIEQKDKIWHKLVSEIDSHSENISRHITAMRIAQDNKLQGDQ